MLPGAVKMLCNNRRPWEKEFAGNVIQEVIKGAQEVGGRGKGQRSCK